MKGAQYHAGLIWRDGSSRSLRQMIIWPSAHRNRCMETLAMIVLFRDRVSATCKQKSLVSMRVWYTLKEALSYSDLDSHWNWRTLHNTSNKLCKLPRLPQESSPTPSSCDLCTAHHSICCLHSTELLLGLPKASQVRNTYNDSYLDSASTH